VTEAAPRAAAARACTPEETLERVRPLLPALGITRIANVTGLDMVGIPVAAACRPNARSNAVAQGKGLDLPAAKASAVMEAVEGACAERIALPLRTASAAQLQGEGLRPTDWRSLPPAAAGRAPAEHTSLPWIEGRDLIDSGAVWLPFETVHADFGLPPPPGSGWFLASTNGLASGNDEAEALLHALCEVIERDAAALFELRPPEAVAARRVELGSIDDPDCRMLLERFAAAGVAVAVWDIHTEIGLPAFRCHAMERSDAPDLLPLPAEGHGCHPDRRVALARALTEAAQARVTVISGARDDIGRRYYGTPAEPEALARWRALVTSSSWGCRFGEAQGWAAGASADDLARVLGRLRTAGIAQAIAVDLTPDPSFPVRIVRVVVPGLEGLGQGMASPRAYARVGRTRMPVRWVTAPDS
jgi:YcaO-like protein with predicted kinase domain